MLSFPKRIFFTISFLLAWGKLSDGVIAQVPKPVSSSSVPTPNSSDNQPDDVILDSNQQSSSSSSVTNRTQEDPKPFEVSSLRNVVLVDLGVVETGQKREFTIRLVNKVGSNLNPHTLEKSCGCLSAELLGKSWDKDDTAKVRISLQFPEVTNLRFQQHFVVLDKSEAIAPLEVRIAAKVKQPILFDPSEVRIDSMELPVERTINLVGKNPSDDFSAAVVRCSFPGVTLEVSRREKSQVALTLKIEPKQVFRGHVRDTIAISVQGVKRLGTEKYYSGEVPLYFDSIILPFPGKITFLKAQSEDKYVARVHLLGTALNQPGEDSKFADIQAHWENDARTVPVEYKYVGPNAVSATIEIRSKDVDHRDVNNLSFSVKSKGEVLVPVEFIEQ